MPVSFLLLLVGSLPIALAFMTLLLGGIRDTNDAIMMTGIGVVGAVIWTTGVLIARRGDLDENGNSSRGRTSMQRRKRSRCCCKANDNLTCE